MNRRHFVTSLGAIAAASFASPAIAGKPRRAAGERALERLERKAGGRLGAHVFNPATGQSFGWRSGERFAMCSTFKLSLAALTLREIDAGRVNAQEVLPYAAIDLLPNSPVSGAHAGEGGMAVLDLAKAAQQTSDNLAANLVMKRLGGAAALTAFWRSLGDAMTSLDRYETDLNKVAPGQVQDTTSPEAMARSAAAFLLGDVLTPASRQMLLDWTATTATGLNRIRAGVPKGWRAGDKTGTAYFEGFSAKVNDVAVLIPPQGAALVVTAFYEPPGDVQDMRPQDEAVLAEVGRIAAHSRSWNLRR
jgi:beta-lactamase class A